MATELNAFPSEDAPQATKKTKPYIKRYGQSIYTVYKKYNTSSSERNDYIVARKYSEGMQSTHKYKNLLGIADGKTSHLNLDFTIVPVISKYVEIRRGEMMAQDYKIFCQAIDPTSKTTRQKERDKLVANMNMKQDSDELEALTGIPLIPKGEYVPDDEDELNLHMSMHFKMDIEVATEEFIDFELKNNDWDQLRSKVAKDFIDIKRAGVKIFYDENFKIRIEYVDWADVLLPFSVRDDMEDCRYVARIMKVSIRDLRRELISDGQKITEELEKEFFEIAEKYSGKDGNRKWTYGSSHHQYYDQNSYSYEYDDFLVPVLEFEFISVNSEYFSKTPKKSGGFFLDHKKTPPTTQKNIDKTTEKKLDYLYKGKWVIDSDLLYNYGMAEDILRIKRHKKYSPKTMTSYILLAPDQRDMKNRSLVQKMMPHADQIQLIKLKLQHLIADLTPPGISVDVNSLADVILGKGGAWTPLDLMELYKQTGRLFHNSYDEEDRPSNRRPIEEIKNSLGTILTELWSSYQSEIQCIRDVTGINEFLDASSPDKDAPVGTAQMARMGGRNASKSMDENFKWFHERVARRVALMVQYNIANNRNIEYYTNALGENAVSTIDYMTEFRLRDLAISIEALPDDTKKMIMEANIQKAIENKELRVEDGMVIRDISNIKLATRYMVARRKTYDKEKMEREKEMIRTQMEEANKAGMQKEQETQKTVVLETQSEEVLIKARLKADIALQDKKHKDKMKEIDLLNEGKEVVAQQGHDHDFQQTALTSAVETVSAP